MLLNAFMMSSSSCDKGDGGRAVPAAKCLPSDCRCFGCCNELLVPCNNDSGGAARGTRTYEKARFLRARDDDDDDDDERRQRVLVAMKGRWRTRDDASEIRSMQTTTATIQPPAASFLSSILLSSLACCSLSRLSLLITFRRAS
jgi:hypothetical protein